MDGWMDLVLGLGLVGLFADRWNWYSYQSALVVM